jgi:Rap1a immunity proteins
MKTLTLGLIASSVLLVAVAQGRDETSESGLARSCSEYPSSSEASAQCLGFINGVVDTLRMFDRVRGTHLVCMPDSTPADAMVKAVKDYLLSHPTNSSLQAASAVLVALSHAYPCTGT